MTVLGSNISLFYDLLNIKKRDMFLYLATSNAEGLLFYTTIPTSPYLHRTSMQVATGVAVLDRKSP